MVSFIQTIKDKLSSLQTNGEAIIFCEDEQSLWIEGKRKDGTQYRKPVVTPTDQFDMYADLTNGHLYYKYGGTTNAE